MEHTDTFANNIKRRTFCSSAGTEEIVVTVCCDESLPLKTALNEMAEGYSSFLANNGLDSSTQQFTCIYLSDATNEEEVFLCSQLYEIVSSGLVSIVQQRPLGSAVAMISFHLKNSASEFKKTFFSRKENGLWQNLFTQGKNYSLLWSANYSGVAQTSEEQTNQLFSAFCAALQSKNLSLRDNTVRTWIYVRDVDNNYSGMVTARKSLFSSIGLTENSRYIASTGIEGRCADPHTLIMMNAFSISNIKEQQIVRMEAPDHLSKTITYGVTFERGLRIRFGDRSHLYISGTASIDKGGKILHDGDVEAQAMRTLENIEALLAPHNAFLENFQYLIVYLRNPKHYQFVLDLINSRISPDLPIVFLEAPVCRPGWLIEIEGLAIIPDSTEYPSLF